MGSASDPTCTCGGRCRGVVSVWCHCHIIIIVIVIVTVIYCPCHCLHNSDVSYLRHVIKIERVIVHSEAHYYRMQQQLVTVVRLKEE